MSIPIGAVGSAMKAKHVVQIICATRALAREYVSECHRAAESFQLRPVVRLAEAQQLGTGVSVFLLDQSGVEGQSKQALKGALDRLVEVAPVIVVAAPERQSEFEERDNSSAASVSAV